jgi:hypothetical protein
VLDAENRKGALFVFQIASKLTAAGSASVRLVNGASPCNVFWQVGSSATVGTNAGFVGTILALTSISLFPGASLEGRALARNGAVTLDSNRITDSVCEDTTVAACCDDSSVCSGACFNLQKDANHCGACGTSCTASEICAGGACTACPGSQTCVAGACTTCEATLCSNLCVETHTDRNNCGACGNTCATGECCHDGACTAGAEAGSFCQHP